MLNREKSNNLTVLVVWEPILASDWSRPTRPVLARIPDQRVIQFWDKDHLTAKQLDGQLSNRQPSCCRHAGILWDLVALYPKGVQWGSSEPMYIDGPVVKVKAELAKQTSTSSHWINENDPELGATANRDSAGSLRTEVPPQRSRLFDCVAARARTHR